MEQGRQLRLPQADQGTEPHGRLAQPHPGRGRCPGGLRASESLGSQGHSPGNRRRRIGAHPHLDPAVHPGPGGDPGVRERVLRGRIDSRPLGRACEEPLLRWQGARRRGVAQGAGAGRGLPLGSLLEAQRPVGLQVFPGVHLGVHRGRCHASPGARSQDPGPDRHARHHVPAFRGDCLHRRRPRRRLRIGQHADHRPPARGGDVLRSARPARPDDRGLVSDLRHRASRRGPGRLLPRGGSFGRRRAGDGPAGPRAPDLHRQAGQADPRGARDPSRACRPLRPEEPLRERPGELPSGHLRRQAQA